MTELCELATKYGTDKAGWYTPVYDLLLRDRRMQIDRILEIGIGTQQAMQHVPNYKPGASLRMWRDYCPFATVYGVDINTDVLFQEERIYTASIDQGNEAQLKEFAKRLDKVDLIIDDGSHKTTHQILGVKTLFPYVREGGLYIIEDVNDGAALLQEINIPALCITYPTIERPTGYMMVFRG